MLVLGYAGLELASRLTKTGFKAWPLVKREAYLKAHPNSQFHYHNLMTNYGMELPDPARIPKLGTKWRDHSALFDPEHHRRHAKGHLIRAAYLEDKAAAMKPKSTRTKELQAQLLRDAHKSKQWAARHKKLYVEQANYLLTRKK